MLEKDLYWRSGADGGDHDARAGEKCDGSALGDRLNYWDVKMSIQYDFMLK